MPREPIWIRSVEQVALRIDANIMVNIIKKSLSTSYEMRKILMRSLNGQQYNIRIPRFLIAYH